MSVETIEKITSTINEIIHKVEIFQGKGNIISLKNSVENKKPVQITGKCGIVDLEFLVATASADNSELVVEVRVLQSASPEYIVGKKYSGVFRLP